VKLREHIKVLMLYNHMGWEDEENNENIIHATFKWEHNFEVENKQTTCKYNIDNISS
jgi:hypothetical protein